MNLVIIYIDNKGQNGTTIFNILDNTTELRMTKYIIGEIFSSGGATLYNNPSEQTVMYYFIKIRIILLLKVGGVLLRNSSCNLQIHTLILFVQ